MIVQRKFSREFKQAAIRQMAGGKSAAEVARALEVHPSDLYRWRRELNEHGARGVHRAGPKAGRGRPSGRAGTKGRSAGAGDRFFKASLAACRGTAPAAGTEQRRAFYQQVEKEMKAGTELSVERDVRVWRGSAVRATIGHSIRSDEPSRGSEAARRHVTEVALEWPAYGSRRIRRN